MLAQLKADATDPREPARPRSRHLPTAARRQGSWDRARVASQSRRSQPWNRRHRALCTGGRGRGLLAASGARVAACGRERSDDPTHRPHGHARSRSSTTAQGSIKGRPATARAAGHGGPPRPGRHPRCEARRAEARPSRSTAARSPRRSVEDRSARPPRHRRRRSTGTCRRRWHHDAIEFGPHPREVRGCRTFGRDGRRRPTTLPSGRSERAHPVDERDPE